MFISRRKYEEAIEKAKRETEERIWQSQRICDLEDRLNRRIDEVTCHANHKPFPSNIAFGEIPSPMNLNPVADAVVNILSSVLKKLIDNKEKFCLTDEDKEVIEAKELLKKMEGVVNE